MATITFSVAGLGSRGKNTYIPAIMALPGRATVVAAADPDPEKVKAVQQAWGVSAQHCFRDAESMLAAGKLSDVMVIATQDRQHAGQAIEAMKLGYDLILEKPIAPTLQDCQKIAAVARETKRKVVVCHVLRYTPFFKKLKSILDEGIIGEVVTVNAVENVGYWHQAHSFVRGNWRQSQTTSPMILSKSCHDLDLYPWLIGRRYESIASMGNTFLFRSDKAPRGAATFCLDGCDVKQGCPFDAEKIYVQNKDTGIAHGHAGWPNDVLSLHPTVESIYEALRQGPYGRCVYHCDNDVVDHQVVQATLSGGATMSFVMSGFNRKKSRYAQLMGTRGEIFADMSEASIEIVPFHGESWRIDMNQESEGLTGHGGGDARLIEEFLDYVQKGQVTPSLTTLEASLESHAAAFAAETSRLGGGKVQPLAAFARQSRDR